MAENSLKWLEMAGTAENGWNFLKMVGNVEKFVKLVGYDSGFTLLEMALSGLKWLEMVKNYWKWRELAITFRDSEYLGFAGFLKVTFKKILNPSM